MSPLSVYIVPLDNIFNLFLYFDFAYIFFPVFKLLFLSCDILMVWPVQWEFEGGVL